MDILIFLLGLGLLPLVLGGCLITPDSNGLVTIPANWKNIEKSAFDQCLRLKTLDFESGSQLQTIGESAFHESGLSGTITIPASVTSIGEQAFWYCNSLNNLVFQSSSQLLNIGEYAFQHSGVSGTIIIPASVTIIQPHAFLFCDSLKTVVFSCESSVSIGYEAFTGTDVSSISLPHRARCDRCGATVNPLDACYPTGQPTAQPTTKPTQPTGQPSALPTGQPTTQPSSQPTAQPSAVPTGQPSTQPTAQPSAVPTGQPTGLPSVAPTSSPTFRGTRNAHFNLTFDQSRCGKEYNYCRNVTLTGIPLVEATYLSVFPPKLPWLNGEFINLYIRKKGGGVATIQCSPLERGDCGDKEFGFCVVNYNVTGYVHPEHGGTLYVDLYSNAKRKECTPQMQFEVTRNEIPTAVPTMSPTHQVESFKGEPFDVTISPSTVGVAAAFAALLTLGLGVYFSFLRKDSKATEITVLKAGVVMLIFGGEFATTIVLLKQLFESQEQAWGVVISVARLLHALVAAFLLATIYGSSKLQERTGLVGLLDRKHMGLNSKMYALASCCCIFDIQTFLLLPWKESEFTKQCSGTVPNMLMFRTVQLTTIFTSLVNIGSQIPYLSTTPFNVYTSFFYVNIVFSSFRALISMLAYCVLAGVLQQCDVAMADDSDYSTRSHANTVEMTPNVLHIGVDGSNQQVVLADLQEVIKQLQLRFQLQEKEANNQKMQMQQQLEQQQQQQQQQLQLQRQLDLMMQKIEELQRQLTYGHDDIPMAKEPDASQV
eukprot:GSChrysophyteH1.ASY1.ANO1.1394.1 assembled CDS